MGKAGQKPTNRGAKYVFEDDEWWYYYPEDGTSIHTGGHLRERASTLKKRIASRMYVDGKYIPCLLYTSPSPRDGLLSRMPSSA